MVHQLLEHGLQTENAEKIRDVRRAAIFFPLGTSGLRASVQN